MLEILDAQRANLYWYTYDEEGNQRWLTGVGEIDGASIIFPEVIITQGGRFGPDFDPDEVLYEVAGQVQMHFEGCATGAVDYDVLGHSGTIPVERLTRTMAAECPPYDGQPVTHSRAADSGSWYDPAHSGEGFAVQWLDRGEAVVTWYSYDSDGNQQWMTGVGQLDADGRLVVPELHATRGARFGDDFDPDDVKLVPWGELVLDLDCGSGVADYESVLPEFGSGRQQLTRLTALDGLDCPLFMPAVGALDAARWDERFTIAGVSNSFAAPPQIFDFAPAGDGAVWAAGLFSWFGQRMVPPLLRGRAADGQWAPPPSHLDLAAVSVTAIATIGEDSLVAATADSVYASESTGEILIEGEDGWQPIGRFNGAVRRLLWHGGELWAAGWFQFQNGGPSHLAVWDGGAWRAPPGGEPDGPVLALADDGQGLLAGGEFRAIGGIEARNVARLDDAGWSARDLPSFRIYALLPTEEGLLAAGAVEDPNQCGVGGVARWNGSGWDFLGTGLSNEFSRGVVTDIHQFRDDLYAIGCFEYANGPPMFFADAERALGIARWNGARWQSLDDGSDIPTPSLFFDKDLCGDEGDPNVIWLTGWQRLASDGDFLYIGGAFGGIAGVDSHSLIAYDGERFVKQGETGTGLAGNYAHGLTIGPHDTAYGFVWAGGGEAPVTTHVARFDSQTGWRAFGPALPENLHCTGSERGIVVNEHGDIMVGCNDVSGKPGAGSPSGWQARVLRLDNDAWVSVETARSFGPLRAIVLDPGGQVWISGGYIDGETGEGYLARLEDNRFEVIEDGFDGSVSRLSFSPEARADGEHDLLIGGNFARIGTTTFNHIAHFDGQEWTRLGDGLASSPQAIEYGAERIYASDSLQGAENALSLGAWDGERWTELATAERNFPPLGPDSAPWFDTIREAGQRLYLAGNIVPADIEGWLEHGLRLYVFEDDRFSSLGGSAIDFVDDIVLSHDALWFVGQIYEADPAGQPVSSVGLARLAWP